MAKIICNPLNTPGSTNFEGAGATPGFGFASGRMRLSHAGFGDPTVGRFKGR